MAVYQKYTASPETLVEADNAGTAVWKVALALTVNPADTSFVAGTTDLATGGGYTQGGNTATTTSSAQTGGVYRLILANPAQWVGSGGGFTFRYIILYNSTNNTPYGYWDYGSAVPLAATQTFDAVLDGANGAFTVQ
jgi:hypothetical protein